MSHVDNNINKRTDISSAAYSLKPQPASAVRDAGQVKDAPDSVSVTDAVKNMSAVFKELKRPKMHYEQHYDVDKDLDRLVVRIISSDTKELIRQIPTEESISLVKRMRNTLASLYNL